MGGENSLYLGDKFRPRACRSFALSGMRAPMRTVIFGIDSSSNSENALVRMKVRGTMYIVKRRMTHVVAFALFAHLVTIVTAA